MGGSGTTLTQDEQGAWRLLQILILTLVLLQRFAVPFNGISVAVPVVVGLLVLVGMRRLLVTNSLRSLLYLAALSCCLAVSIVASAFYSRPLSMNSILLLLVVYAPLCYQLRPQLQILYPRVLEFFNTVMVFAACAALLQWVAQVLGWSYRDLLLEVLPPQYLVQDYNTAYPLYYGSSIYKSNAVVFLEPSFCSQFLALAILVQLLRGGKRWRLCLYAAALLTTLSGTGFALLAVGLMAMAFERGGRWATGAFAGVSFVVVALLATPVGQLIADRADETQQPGSSGNARFVQPFTQVLSGLARDEDTFLVGRGAGSSTREAAVFFNPGRLEANYSVAPKLAAEYGVPATVLFVVFVLCVFLRAPPSRTLAITVVPLYFLLSSSLLQPQTVYLAWMLTGLFAAPQPRSVQPAAWDAISISSLGRLQKQSR